MATSGRADYGLLCWPMRDIAAAAGLSLQLLVTGTHLEPRFGTTVERIEADGFVIDARVPMALTGDDPATLARASGLALTGTVEALQRLRPDVLLLLGDRFETLALAQAAMLVGVPVAHIGGGDVTEGAFDEGIRHAITKLSHLHLVTHADAARRVVRLGEPPERVHVVGNPGLDALTRAPTLTRDVLEATLGRPLGARNLLVTFHPVTVLPDGGWAEFQALLGALEPLTDVTLWMTKANADPGGGAMNAALEAFADGRSNVSLHDALGPAYLPLMAACDAVVGNSSSGLAEAPSVRTPTVDIGLRQRGRLAGPSVLHCAAEPAAISQAIGRAMAGEAADFENPYGDGRSSARIVQALIAAPSRDLLLRKRFFEDEQPDD
ncbi:UDP-N-acetylglucosamine 2-epimerase [Brevundimonas basaltis]|uniref:UDP-hydrolyzing UDP-N-acetyl-D-glucosamine 2-epimerase n=1 Tax=Brevundimonas basaltis TaxID=472166 RepID=A0A7W8HZT3_9CAUL|nr:UDP-hydrolyzing UDP-N-acetyl-D-glucosamine 2-epimerase [Brevundimonas basaltis]